MKWILMLSLLIACGKHEAPKSKDLGDSDGDQILNHQEDGNGSNKFVADLTPIAELKGSLHFYLGDVVKKEHVIDFNNRSDLSRDSMTLLTKSKKAIKVDDFFSEWSILRFQQDQIPKEPTLDQIVEVRMNFADVSQAPSTILLITSKGQKLLSEWSPNTVFRLTREDFEDVLKGKKSLALGKLSTRSPFFDFRSKEDTIKSKTYRVYLNDGQKVKVLYVSKELSLDDLLLELNIREVKLIDQVDLLQTSPDDRSAQWWFRDLGSDKVLYFGSQYSIMLGHFGNFYYHHRILQRKDGKASESFSIKKNPDARFFLRLRTQKTIREIATRSTVEHYAQGGGGGRDGNGVDRWDCRYDYRYVAKETPVVTTIQDIFDHVEIVDDKGQPMPQSQLSIFERADEKGSYWELSLDLPLESLGIRVKELPPSTNVAIGLYNTNCGSGGRTRPLSTHPLSIESFFNLELEAYVEKL